MAVLAADGSVLACGGASWGWSRVVSGEFKLASAMVVFKPTW